MPGKRKQIRDKWKADRKIQLQMNRRKKAIRFVKANKAASASGGEEKKAA